MPAIVHEVFGQMAVQARTNSRPTERPAATALRAAWSPGVSIAPGAAGDNIDLDRAQILPGLPDLLGVALTQDRRGSHVVEDEITMLLLAH